MKPHEETWKRKGNDVVTSPRGRVLTVVRLYPSDDASLDLAAAAPEMARVLLHVLACRNPSGRCPSCDRKVRHALGLAGVDIP